MSWERRRGTELRGVQLLACHGLKVLTLCSLSLLLPEGVMLWIRGHFQQSSSDTWYLSCWCPESESGGGGRLEMFPNWFQAQGFTSWLCLVNNLSPLQGKAWAGITPSHKEPGVVGSWLSPQLPFAGTRKVSLSEGSPLQPQGTGSWLPCGSRAPGAVHWELFALGSSQRWFPARSSQAEQTAPSTALRNSALSLLFLAPSRLPG